jgi:hypothetical protein
MGCGPDRSNSVNKWHCVLVVRQQSATTRWARLYRRATSRSKAPEGPGVGGGLGQQPAVDFMCCVEVVVYSNYIGKKRGFVLPR